MTDKILAKNLAKSYEKFKLGPNDFAIKKGFVTGFIGKNGMGKTTTIKALLSLINYDGEIFLDGKKINDLTYLQDVGLVMDDSFLGKDWTLDLVNEAMAIGYDRWDSKVYYEYLNKFELEREKKVSDLSRGMKIKLMLAVALSHDAKILILDEPTSGLDPAMRDQLVDMILDFMEDPDHTVLFSTHITQDLDRIADYIVFIDQGKIVFEGIKDELYDKFLLIKGGLEDYERIKNLKIYGQKKTKVNFEALILREDYKEDDNLVAEVPTIDQIMIYYGRI
ncbi:ABC transporter ATP-binding protein [Anaerococcus degeneri]|uniref:ABC transporter ATP-binding protein n=1 Tax=Anaerococcus degeneri TaxID=361500 RepID=A0ABS7YYP3_9FIRM|nr:ABC transporter ATP-binding protein [Anaerococcus degeneri]MBP2014637.1 ABC-2 type transport system ATP-binding protein [Anaerococcus degeneri]MCA2096850.1 ABC transporter ATP-binding protein [Anaerococcus degeneri]